MARTINTQALDRALGWASRTTARILKVYAALFLIAIAAIIIEIVARFYGYATTVSVELSGYVMASIIAWASSYALLQKCHVRIDLLYRARPDRAKSLLDILSISSFFAVAVFLAWSTAYLALDSFEFGVVSNTTQRVPLWIPQASWSLGFIWLAICAGLLAAKAILAWLNEDRAGVVAAVGVSDEAPL